MTPKPTRKKRVQSPTTKLAAPLRLSPQEKGPSRYRREPPTPAPASTLLPDDPPSIRHHVTDDPAALSPYLLTILCALQRTGAATGLDEPRWTWAIRQPLDAGLVDKEGERRWTPYRLTR